MISRTTAPGLLEEWGAPQPSDLARAIETRRRQGLPVTDLITSNPQENGFEFPAEILDDVISRAAERSRTYRPDARGQLSARESIARYHGNEVTADSVILTPGTSFAYWAAFRLLFSAGENVLCPAPTYPLFDDLARLAGIEIRRYHLHRHEGRWIIDPQEIAFQANQRTRAVVIVSPHNPTGTVTSPNELQSLAALARANGWTVIMDEVFREFTHADVAVSRPSEFDAPLTLTLNGISKMFSLPGWKGGWIAAEGDADQRDRFLNAAEYLMDSFLPVSEVTQASFPLLLDEHLDVAHNLADRYRVRMRSYVDAWRTTGACVALPQAGVYLPVELPREADGEDVAARCLNKAGVLVHPGELYAMPRNTIVTTCVARPPWHLSTLAAFVR